MRRVVPTVMLLVAFCSVANSEACRVTVPDGGGVHSVGHGVYVGNGIVLTAHHVIRDARGMPTCRFLRSGVTVRGLRLAREAGGYDLAAIKIQVPDTVRASKLCSVWPSGTVRSLRSTGRPFSRFSCRAGKLLSFSGPSVQGDSGGPIWCKDGVVSIISTSDLRSHTNGPPPSIVSGFVRTLQQRWCPPGAVCPAPDPSVPSNRVPPVPSLPPTVPGSEQASTVPSLLPMVPDSESKPRAPKEQMDLDSLAESIIEKMASDPRFKGPPGEPGPPGPQGEPGPAPTTDYKRQLTEIRADVEANNRAIQRIIDKQRQITQVIDEHSNSTFEVEITYPDGTISTGNVHAHGGLLKLDFSRPRENVNADSSL